jgi:DnaK suppressor protein
MFVSILQLMGFKVGKPVHSRAGESAPVLAPLKAKAGKAKAPKQATHKEPARRPPMKAQTDTAKPVSKTSAVAKPKAVPAKTTAAKAASDPARGLAKLVEPAAEVNKDKVKDSVKTTIAKAAKSEVAPSKPKAAAPVAPVKAAAVAEPAAPASASVPARAGRPSSRLAQLTVPSMAQSVASTAAKASFTQTVESPPIVPPLASSVKKDPKLANNWKLHPVGQLTDADLIAMPDDEYMNDTQMAYFRLKLNKLKQEILSNAGETTEHLREDTVVVPDPADRATIEEEHALELRTRDRERKLLKKIEQSIQRIDAGDYGYCDETGEPIGVGRLLARPTANLSLEAQQRRELKQKMFGD